MPVKTQALTAEAVAKSAPMADNHIAGLPEHRTRGLRDCGVGVVREVDSRHAADHDYAKPNVKHDDDADREIYGPRYRLLRIADFAGGIGHHAETSIGQKRQSDTADDCLR